MKYFVFFFKTLFFQGNWNYENMQGTGFSWVARSLLGEDLKEEDSERLSEYFNTSPPFFPLLIIIFVKKYKESGADAAFNIKRVYSSALAALGDSFFWHALRPFLFLMSLYLAGFYNPLCIFLYPLLYVIGQLLFFTGGILIGLRMGDESILFLNKIKFNRWSTYLDSVSVFLLGAISMKIIKSFSEDDISLYIISICMFVLGFILHRYVRLSVLMWGLIVIMLLSLGFYGGYELWLNPV